MYQRSTTPVRDHLAAQTRDPITKDDTIDPILSTLFIETARHIPLGTLAVPGGDRLTVDDVAASLDSLIGYLRLWSERAMAAEEELRTLRAERATVRAYFGVQP